MIKGNNRRVPAGNLEVRQDVATLRGGDEADVRRRFAHRIGAHAVRAAEREFLRGREVLRGALSRKRGQHADVVRYALQTPRIDVVFAPAPERLVARGTLVERQHAARLDAGFAVRPGEGVGVQSSAEEGVAEVADDADLQVADVAHFDRVLRLDAVDELLVFVGKLDDQVRVA